MEQGVRRGKTTYRPGLFSLEIRWLTEYRECHREGGQRKVTRCASKKVQSTKDNVLETTSSSESPWPGLPEAWVIWWEELLSLCPTQTPFLSIYWGPWVATGYNIEWPRTNLTIQEQFVPKPLFIFHKHPSRLLSPVVDRFQVLESTSILLCALSKAARRNRTSPVGLTWVPLSVGKPIKQTLYGFLGTSSFPQP